MEIDPLKLLSRLTAKPDKTNATLKLNSDIYRAFQEACESHRLMPSHVVEEFMRECCERWGKPIATQSALTPARRKILAALAALDEAEVAGWAELIALKLANGGGRGPAAEKRKKAK